jgi:sec-independent protein translocase protein TatA
MQPVGLALLFGNLGTGEILIILLVLLLLFGGKKIPELARGLGRGIAEFRQGMKEPPVPRPPEKPEDPSSPKEPPKTT